MITTMQQVSEVERETCVTLNLTPREEKLLEALQFMLDQYYAQRRQQRQPLSTLFSDYEKEQSNGK